VSSPGTGAPGEAGSCPGIAASGAVALPSWYQLPAGTPEPVAVAISYALRQLGKSYIWGGTGPAGYDCSGLVMMAYAAARRSIPRTTFEQVDAGTAVVSFSELLPGDLLFEAGSDGSNPGHVGMYIGDGLVIRAPSYREDAFSSDPRRSGAGASALDSSCSAGCSDPRLCRQFL
jgi:cell wall-associated NlpC family hydrolase